ncbi:MAG: hypothetical protein KF886_21665 [Candidatus Hydrogenedentes bacterium]|nr:hypothetical protein [Candidatus Hydrogenedentota bacterium]
MNQPPELPRPKPRRGAFPWRLTMVALAPAVLLVAAAAVLITRYDRALRSELDSMRAAREEVASELEAKGYPVTDALWEARFPQPADTENGALVYGKASAAMRALPPEQDLLVPYAGKLDPPDPGAPYPEDALSAMRAHLAANEDALAIADEAVGYSRNAFAQYGLDEERLSALYTAEALTTLLMLRIEILSLDGNREAMPGALVSLHAAVQMLDESPEQIDAYVAMRMRREFAGMVARVFSRYDPGEELLNLLAGLDWRIPAEEVYSNAVVSGAGRIVTPEESILLIALHDKRLILPFPKRYKARWAERIIEEYALYDFRFRQDVLALAGETAAEAIPRYEALEQAFKAAVAEALILFNAPIRLDPVWEARACDRMSEAAIAVERWRRENGMLPNSLESLVPDFFPAIPRDPYDGQPLRYRVEGAGYLLHCVGLNLADDGGATYTRRPQQLEKGDVVLVVRLDLQTHDR